MNKLDTNTQQWKRAGELRSYGRRKGRKLSELQQRLWDELLPSLKVIVPDNGMLDISSEYQHTWFEIGFGAGEHLAAMAMRYPNVLFIGCEPFVNGAAQCLVHIHEHHIKNIRIFPDNAQLLLDALPDNSITRADILFPDPWRKKSHHKRRIINPITLAKLARIMPQGAELRLASDHEDYVAWMLEQVALSANFDWSAQSQADFLEPPDDWVNTRYQDKALRAGRHATFINCIRNAAVTRSFTREM